MKRKCVAFISVAYNSDAETLEFAKRLSSMSAESDVVSVVVDNGPHVGKRRLAESIAAVNPWLACITPPANLGYFGGAQFALEWLCARHNAADWVVVSNIDVQFAPNFVEVLRSRRSDPDEGVLAPSIWSNHLWRDLNPNMVARPNPSRMHFYSRLYSQYWLLNAYQIASVLKHRSRGLFRSIGKNKLILTAGEKSRTRCERQVYAPHGSCAVFADAYFRSGGSFRYPCFLFGEEIFVAEFCRRQKLRIVYCPALVASHDDHVSTGVLRSRQIASYVAKSAKFLAKEYFA